MYSTTWVVVSAQPIRHFINTLEFPNRKMADKLALKTLENVAQNGGTPKDYLALEGGEKALVLSTRKSGQQSSSR